MPLKDKDKYNAYMRNYYKTHKEQNAKHRKLCQDRRDRVKHAQNTVQ